MVDVATEETVGAVAIVETVVAVATVETEETVETVVVAETAALANPLHFTRNASRSVVKKTG